MASRIFRDDLLAGQVALLSGGGSGIGRATALELAALGAHVLICGRREEPLSETASMQPDGRIEGRACDVREVDQVDALVDHALERHGRIDLLVNNAGGQFLAPAEAISFKGFQTVMRMNIDSTWLMTHAVARKAMIPKRAGKVVTVTLSPHQGLPGMAHSSLARAAQENMMRVLAIEWARFGICLNAVAPSQVATDTYMSKYPDHLVDQTASTIPLQRMGTAEEVAWMIAYLASPAGDWVSGAVFTVDGGRDNWFGRWPPPQMADADGEPLVEARRPPAAG
ncbi:MAG TPA: SDR family oxidoreductase [Solirubrobacteraceae bacterium]|nr:SDR family oxidoreductase [Solirubrobacteraceae bacterium]